MTATERFDAETQKNVDEWLTDKYDAKTRQEVLALIRDDPTGAMDAFYTKLSFGTGGLRGIVGIGTNRMNKYTVQMASQGVANYLKRQGFSHPSVLIGYDSRHQSPEFAQEVARVFAGNGILVYLFRQLRPTPLVSFGCRARHCSAAVMITASHNPPQYNGYKVYWSDGGQILPPHDQGIIGEINQIHGLTHVMTAPLSSPLIHWIEEELDVEYLDKTEARAMCPKDNHAYGKELKIVYSSLHGTGITLVPKILARWGFSNLILVEEQAEPNGYFPTVKTANPEERAALDLGIQKLLSTSSDILLATDPDADRVGVAVRCGCTAELLNGNQLAAICLEHICDQRAVLGEKSSSAACIKTIVTTPLFRAIADHYGVACFDVLPGFKYVSRQIHEWEKTPESPQFLFAGEESFGYLLGTASLDKDGVISCALLCEVALQAKRAGKTLLDRLWDLYKKYGIYREKLISISYPETRDGRTSMISAMSRLREHPPQTLRGSQIVKQQDYKNLSPVADILSWILEDGSWVVVRPSGTEPKIKLYAGTQRPGADLATVTLCDNHLDRLLQDAERLLRYT